MAFRTLVFDRVRGAPGASATRPRRLGTLPSHPHASGPPLKLPRDRACLAVGDREPIHGCLLTAQYWVLADGGPTVKYIAPARTMRRPPPDVCAVWDGMNVVDGRWSMALIWYPFNIGPSEGCTLRRAVSSSVNLPLVLRLFA